MAPKAANRVKKGGAKQSAKAKAKSVPCVNHHTCGNFRNSDSKKTELCHTCGIAFGKVRRQHARAVKEEEVERQPPAEEAPLPAGPVTVKVRHPFVIVFVDMRKGSSDHIVVSKERFKKLYRACQKEDPPLLRLGAAEQARQRAIKIVNIILLS